MYVAQKNKIAIFPAVHGKKGTGKRGTNEILVKTAQKEKKMFLVVN